MEVKNPREREWEAEDPREREKQEGEHKPASCKRIDTNLHVVRTPSSSPRPHKSQP